MIENVEDYKEFTGKLRADLMALNEGLPKGDKRKKMLQVAVELDLSFMTVANYLDGKGSSPETGLAILEKFKELV